MSWHPLNVKYRTNRNFSMENFVLGSLEDPRYPSIVYFS